MLRAATPVPVSLGSPIIGLGRFVHLTLLVVAALVVPAVGFQVAACTDHGLPVQPRTSGPQFEIQDGAHNSGNAHFFFLPPMVAQPAVSGTFDGDLATLNPLVAICDITYGPDVDCGSNATPATVVFTTATTPAITVDPTTPQYQVNWDTQGANFVGGHTYRVHLTAGATRTRRELGFADIMLTTTPGQAKRAATGDLILIKDGRTLPIHFRIETGIVGAVAVVPATATVTVGQAVQLGARLSDLHGETLIGPAVLWGVFGNRVVTVDGDGLVTGVATGSATISATSEGVAGTAAVTVAMPTPTVFTSVSSGVGPFTCALVTGGAGHCWGYNLEGQLGDGSTTNSTTPVLVSGGLRFSTVTGGLTHTCGLATSGAAYCWGFGGSGQLGNASGANTTIPVPVSGGLTFSTVSAGANFTCGVTTSGAGYCWGSNGAGLGDGSTVSSTTPVPVSGGLTFSAVSAGYFHTCGLTTNGTGYCWGYNFSGELGSGSTTNSTTPTLVLGGLTFSALSAGYTHSCGVTTGGAAYCWGYNGLGELGNGSFISSTTPVLVSGALTFSKLSAGQQYTCGLTTSGSAYCWGANTYGQLGNASIGYSSTPAAVSGGLTFVRVSTGFGGAQGGEGTAGHTCGLTTSGATYCWGHNGYGELGNGTTSNSSTPVRVSNP